MKFVLLFTLLVLSYTVRADSIVAVSEGFSFSQLQKQGALIEQVKDTFILGYRVNLDKFENCSVKQVKAIASVNEKKLLSVSLEKTDGWYHFSASSEVNGKDQVYLQIECGKGTPYRNFWL